MRSLTSFRLTRRHFHDADDPATECKGGRRLYYIAYAVIKSATAQSAISVSDALCRLPTNFHARRKLGFRCAPIARATSVGERKTIAVRKRTKNPPSAVLFGFNVFVTASRRLFQILNQRMTSLASIRLFILVAPLRGMATIFKCSNPITRTAAVRYLQIN